MEHALHSLRTIILVAPLPLALQAASAGAAKPDFPLAGVLAASGPYPDRAGARDLYGWMIGHWEAESTFRLPDGTIDGSTGQIHSAWVLEGRAVQDLWISPRVPDRRPGAPRLPREAFGTTLRIYDPAIDAWRVHWFDPQNDAETHIVGRRIGEEIVREKDLPAPYNEML